MVRTPQTKDKIQDAFGKKETTEEQGNERSSSAIKAPAKKGSSGKPSISNNKVSPQITKPPATKLVEPAAKQEAPMGSTEIVNFPLRMPKDLHQGLKHRAWQSQKSLHQHILDTLKRSG